MFEIEYYGANAIALSTKNVRLVVDPNVEQLGLACPNVKDSVVAVTEPRFSLMNDSAKLVIDGPGEYEIGDISIVGVAAQRHIDTESVVKSGTIYRVSSGDVSGAILGNIAATLDDDQLERIGVVDFLVVPVGGNGYTLDSTEAISVIRQIDPKAVIPVHYADSAIKYEVPQDDLDSFIKEMASQVIDGGSRWRIRSRSDIPEALSVIKIVRG